MVPVNFESQTSNNAAGSFFELGSIIQQQVPVLLPGNPLEVRDMAAVPGFPLWCPGVLELFYGAIGIALYDQQVTT